SSAWTRREGAGSEPVGSRCRPTTSTIETFKANELVVKSAAGDTSKLVRMLCSKAPQSRGLHRGDRALVGRASMLVHLLRNPDARYAIGAVVSWPIYGALYIS